MSNSMTVIFILVLMLCCILTAIISVSDEDSKDLSCYIEFKNLTCSDDSYCPTWFYCNTENNSCQCGEGYHGMIACDEHAGRAAVSDRPFGCKT